MQPHPEARAAAHGRLPLICRRQTSRVLIPLLSYCWWFRPQWLLTTESTAMSLQHTQTHTKHTTRHTQHNTQQPSMRRDKGIGPSEKGPASQTRPEVSEPTEIFTQKGLVAVVLWVIGERGWGVVQTIEQGPLNEINIIVRESRLSWKKPGSWSVYFLFVCNSFGYTMPACTLSESNV